MGKRYVWKKYSVLSTTAYKSESSTVSWDSVILSGTSYNIANSYSFDPKTGQYTLTGNIQSVVWGEVGTKTARYAQEPNNKSVLYSAVSVTYPEWTIKSRSGNYVMVASFYEGGEGYFYSQLTKHYSSKTTDYEQGSSYYGYISSAASGTYPIDGKSGSYWYVYQGSDNIDPTSISYSSQVNGGKSTTITVTKRTNTYGGTITYRYEVSVDGGNWTLAKSTTATSISYMVPKGSTSFQARVRASDNYGFTSSDYVIGSVSTVNNNVAPVISSDQAASLGEKNEPFSFTYTVNDEERDTVTVKELLDGVQKRSYTATLGKEETFSVSEGYQQILNGNHTLKVVANDGMDTTEKSWTFTKKVTACSITLETPLDADAAIMVARLAVSGSIPPDANFTVQVTNNGKDDDPVWEDATMAVKNGTNIVFANKEAQNGFAFNFKLDVSRGESDTGGYITSVQGAFQ